MKIKISRSLYNQVLEDLRRPHPFAHERVGFLTAMVGNRGGSHIIALLTEYVPVPDHQYVEDHSVGARINSDAIRSAMQRVLDSGHGLFHVHLHDWSGRSGPSSTDRREIPPIVKSFRNVGASSIHGMLILSADKAMANVWVPGLEDPVRADRITVVGHPLAFLEM